MPSIQALTARFFRYAERAYAALTVRPADTVRDTAEALSIARVLRERQAPVSEEALAYVHWNRGAACYSLTRFAAALACYRKANAIFGRLPADSLRNDARCTLWLNLAFANEQMHYIESGLACARSALSLSAPGRRAECLERIAWFQLLLSRVDEARSTLGPLLAEAHNEYHWRLVLVAFRHDPTAAALRALQGSDTVRASRTLSGQLAVMLSRSGHPRLARPLLSDSPELARCLRDAGRPPQHARPVTLHPVTGPENVNRVVVRPVLAGRHGARFRTLFEAALEQLPAYHQSQWGAACRVEVSSIRCIEEDFSIHQLFDGLDVESHLRRLSNLPHKPGEVVLVGTGTQSGNGPFGFTSGRLAVLSLPRLVYSETLLVHEFYHALLDLEHTDGEADVEDPLSVMAPLECLTYISAAQKQACQTDSQTYRIATSGLRQLQAGRPAEAIARFERALAQDPLQRWVYARLAEAYAWMGDTTSIRSTLERGGTLCGGSWAQVETCHRLAALGQLRRSDMQRLKSWQRAHVYYDAGRYAESRREYLKDGERGYAADGILYCTVAMGEWVAAGQQIERLLRKAPWSWSLYARLAEVETALGNSAAARSALAHAERRTDDPTRLWWHRLAAQRLQGHWASVRRMLSGSVIHAPVPNGPWLELGYAHWQCGQQRAARRAFEQAVLVKPAHTLESRLAAAWSNWLSNPDAPGLPTRAALLARQLPYSIPALHLAGVLAGGPVSVLRRISPHSL